MIVKVLCVAVLMLAAAKAAPKQRKQDRISALLVKDSENGELRFLTGSGASVNQLITQKQDLLEQLRPATGTGIAGGNVTPIIVDLGGAGGIATTAPTLGGTYTTGAGVAGGSTGGLTNSQIFAAAAGYSPIGNLLPQIVGQGVSGGGQINIGNRNNKRRRVNRRRPAQRRRRRRPARRGNNRVRP